MVVVHVLIVSQRIMRHDLSTDLIHFTRGETHDAAYEQLKLILRERCLLASTTNIRGGFPCICFSEAPIALLKHGLINQTGFTRYSPFGLLFSKESIFLQGGRQVIYQPESEYSDLPQALRWRHVRLELDPSFARIDFTWEREWRLPQKSLRFNESEIVVVFPNETYANRFAEEMNSESFYTAWAYTQVLGDIAWAYDTGNPWRCIALKKPANRVPETD